MTATDPKEAAASGGGGAAAPTGGKKDGKTPQAAPAAAPSAGDAPAKKPTGAELKALKQAEKAKRRAAVVAAKEAAGLAVGSAGGPAGGAPAGAGGGKSKATGGPAQSSGSGAPSSGSGPSASASGHGSAGASAPFPGSLARRPSVSAATVAAEREKELRSAVPEAFSHLSMAKRISLSQAHKDVHPAVLAAGQQMATFTLRENVSRLEATLVAFKKVIESYTTPPNNAFSRHFVPSVLNHQIEYLTECRPMCFAMGNAIRLLKAGVSQLDVALDDKAAIAELCENIDGFIQERIYVAAVIITRQAASMIRDGDVILTYGGPRLVRAALEQAWANGTRFDLIVVDNPHDPAAGQALAKQFNQRKRPQQQQRRSAAAAGSSRDSGVGGLDDFDSVFVTYSPSLDGIDSHMAQATKVFLGVESVFANGALFTPEGTCDVAVAASALGRPVLALSETVNFDRDRVATDALAYNEIDPDHCNSDSFRLLFDVTQAHLVSMLITEYEEASGQVPAHAMYSVLRTKEDPN